MNFYRNVNKKFKTKKPTLLETIYENDEEEIVDIKCVSARKIGRKFKRTIAIGDGINATKALKEKRKSLVKKHLGNKKKPKKMALAKFMEYFKEKTEETSKD